MNKFVDYQKNLGNTIKDRAKSKTEIEEVFDVRDGIIESFFHENGRDLKYEYLQEDSSSTIIAKTMNLAKKLAAIDDDNNFIKHTTASYNYSRNFIYIGKMKNGELFAILTLLGGSSYAGYMRMFVPLSGVNKICGYHHSGSKDAMTYKNIMNLSDEDRCKYLSGYYDLNDINYKKRDRVWLDSKPLINNLDYMFEK